MAESSEKLRLGISTCLLGQKVRYDGGHKHDRYLTDTLGQYVEWVPVCPEVECGLPVPREAMHLVGDPAAPRLMTVRTGEDKTDQMLRWARKRVAELEGENLCGFVFKAKSPSSGMERVKVYSAKGIPQKVGVGLFARAFMDHFPLLPVEEDGRLHDMAIRVNFIERIFTLKRWRDTVATGRRTGNLVDFHSRHKLLILSHSTERYREMGRLVAHPKEHAPAELFRLYEQALMENAKGRADSGLNAGPGVLYQFKVEVVGKLGKLGVEYFENQVFSPLPEALKARPPKATIVVRKKGKSSKSGSGSGSSGGGISIKGVELAHRPKGGEVVLGVDAPGEKRFGGVASAGSAALDSYLSKLNPERRAVVEDFSISSPSVWKVIKGEERTDIVEAAFRAISGGSDASAVSSVVFHSALVKLAYGAGLIDDPSAGKVFKSDPAYTIEAGSTWIFGGQQVPVTKK